MKEKNVITWLTFASSLISLAILIYLLFAILNREYLGAGIIGISGIVIPFIVWLVKKFKNKNNAIPINRDFKNANKKWKNLLGKVIDDGCYKWIEDKKLDVIRTDQNLELWLNKYEKENIKAIIITGIHKFKIHNPKENESYTYEMSIHTDIGYGKIYTSDYNNILSINANETKKLEKICANKIQDLDSIYNGIGGGFLRFLINNEEIFSKEKLSITTENKNHIILEDDGTKVYLKYNFEIPKGESISLEFHIYGIFKFEDRLSWIFQNFCENLNIKVYKPENTKLRYRFNHNKRDNLNSYVAAHTGADKKIEEIPIDYPIFPYQGFSLHWDFN